MKYIDVIVSPFFQGGPIHEEKSNLTFEAYDIYPTVYRINKEADLSGIKSLIRQNILVLVEGEIDEKLKVEEVPLKEQPKQEKFIPETAEEALEETKEEVEAQEEREEQLEKSQKLPDKLEDYTVAELKEKADALGIEYKANISKSALLKKLK